MNAEMPEFGRNLVDVEVTHKVRDFFVQILLGAKLEKIFGPHKQELKGVATSQEVLEKLAGADLTLEQCRLVGNIIDARTCPVSKRKNISTQALWARKVFEHSTFYNIWRNSLALRESSKT